MALYGLHGVGGGSLYMWDEPGSLFEGVGT